MYVSSQRSAARRRPEWRRRIPPPLQSRAAGSGRGFRGRGPSRRRAHPTPHRSLHVGEQECDRSARPLPHPIRFPRETLRDNDGCRGPDRRRKSSRLVRAVQLLASSRCPARIRPIRAARADAIPLADRGLLRIRHPPRGRSERTAPLAFRHSRRRYPGLTRPHVLERKRSSSRADLGRATRRKRRVDMPALSRHL